MSFDALRRAVAKWLDDLAWSIWLPQLAGDAEMIALRLMHDAGEPSRRALASFIPQACVCAVDAKRLLITPRQRRELTLTVANRHGVTEFAIRDADEAYLAAR